MAKIKNAAHQSFAVLMGMPVPNKGKLPQAKSTTIQTTRSAKKPSTAKPANCCAAHANGRASASAPCSDASCDTTAAPVRRSRRHR